MVSPITTEDFEELFGVNAGYVEKVYHDYMSSPDSVGDEWRRFFTERGLEAPVAEPTATTTPAPDGAASRPEPGAGSGPADEAAGELEQPLRGVAARIVTNMEDSLSIPTATSSRVVPVKVLEENRRVINQHLALEYRGKASYTHMIAWAMVQTLVELPDLNVSFLRRDGKPFRRSSDEIHLGIAVDVENRDGSRGLVVPNIKNCETLTFSGFLAAFNELIAKSRTGKLAPADFQNTTCTLTNPGMIGTISSLPRLMTGQGFILATGSIGVPAEFMGAAESTLSELGVSKVMTLTNTYDHRVIQGAVSGEFLDRMHKKLAGQSEFYGEIFADLTIPHLPLMFVRDRRAAMGSPMRQSEQMERAARVMQYIRAYRVRGYLLADLDPLEYQPKSFPELELATYGLSIWDLDREFFSSGVTGKPMATLRDIREVLRATYCAHVGVEFMHIADPEQKEWLRVRMEATRNAVELSNETQMRVLDQLIEAEAFERFLHTRFVGHKRFSLEGAESLVPTLDAMLEAAGGSGVTDVVLGMAHRGRLNVLAHILDKPIGTIFSEFEGTLDPDATQGSGDVKYHLGATGTYQCTHGKAVEVELACNPSHLEAVNPVVEGMARARQERFDGEEGRTRVLPVLIHGDAAFAGQGVVGETLNMSQLHGYRTGGTIHVIVNNQIGYTTLPADARSTHYCTDVAKAIQAPIFHANGDDPLAAVRMIQMAVEYRQTFHRDVVLDIVCYRRHGHNEGDEPAFTQPLLYRKIETHPSVREIYQDYLVRAGVIKPADIEKFNEDLQERLRKSLTEVRQETPPVVKAIPTVVDEVWPPIHPASLDLPRLEELTDTLCTPPADLDVHPKVRTILERRQKMIRGEYPIDFAFAEHLAFATLLVDQLPVRLAGQDSGRGTFSQRHSVLMDISVGSRYIPLNFLADEQARYSVIDSFLSEEAALGFEYGYSVVQPAGLTIWEGQFGDFVNGAQIQIDQFLAAGEAKWQQRCGLTLLLPHGYDGQGPEHSSARPERFLQLCAENNMRVAIPSTPAQYFHLLRKQALSEQRKPLIVMTHKSLLRQRYAGSTPDQLVDPAGFREVLADPTLPADQADKVERVVACTGKVFYDLLEQRGESPIAILRLEQLYPFPEAALDAALASYPNCKTLVWCQEEPQNMGAWSYLAQRRRFDTYAGRHAAASPATGFLAAHRVQQAALVKRALGE